MATVRTDPRPARSRARLLEAATTLLRSGGPSAVTVDAVTRASNVARATLYRHFPSGNDLLAAAFHALIPPAPIPPDEGSLRDRLDRGAGRVLRSDRRGAHQPRRDVVAGAGRRPGADAMGQRQASTREHRGAHAARTRRRAVRRPVRRRSSTAPMPSPQLGELDRTRAVCSAARPASCSGKLSTLPNFDYREIAEVAVDGFLATHAKDPGVITCSE